MSMRATLRQMGQEWLVALMSYALLVAPFGCQLDWQLNGGGGGGGSDLNKSSPGLFLNDDRNDPLLVAGRNAAGDAFFVFGTRQSNGAIGEVESILVEQKSGQRSFILFELGRPVLVQGPDGSYVQITYTEVSARRLAATAKVFDARRGATETVDVDIDLAKTAAEVAAALEQATGLTLEVPELPDEATGKLRDRAIGPLLIALAVIPLVLLSQTMAVIMGQVMAAVYEAVSAALQAAVVVAFAPVFLFASLLGEVTVQVESLPLLEVFIELPEPPTIEIEFQ